MNNLKRILTISLFIGLLGCQTPEVSKKETGAYPVKNFPAYYGRYEIPANNPLTYEGVALGRMLFYEKQLSKDNTITCASCHQQKFAFSDGLALSVGFQGRQREVGSMSLANLLWQNRFNWNGSATSLEQQVLMPIQHAAEMNLSLEEAVNKLQNNTSYPPKFKEVFGNQVITSENIAKALAQFLRILVSADSKFDKYLRKETQLSAQELRGRDLLQHPFAGRVRGGNCIDCHVDITFAGSKIGLEAFKNNGLDTDENLKAGLFAITQNPFDKGKFKVPTLRNIALTAPYMHDGRFKTLEEVLDHYNDHIQMSSTLDPLILEATNELFPPAGQVKLGLTAQEKQDIIAFLKTLTDEKFITNPAFSNPFSK
jgi:cytochrome c peroxidase